jgi:predicted metal-dependent enzyme (double-stranded beta helix superfamily)
MKNSSLDNFIAEVTKAWGTFNSKTVADCTRLVESLARSSANEAWAAELRERPQEKELYRDPERGFVLMAHTAQKGQYRPPHDHGTGWVIYAVQSGEMEMSTYRRAVTPRGELHLVRRETYRLLPGDCKTYLPEDIHETLCLSEDAILLRFTSCDLKEEERAGRIVRYPPPAAATGE